MKTKTLQLLLLIFSNLLVFGQTLSKDVRNDFCRNAKYNYFYGTGSFYGLMNISLKKIGLTNPNEMNKAVNNICDNEKLQNIFFENIHSISRGLDRQQYLSIGMKSENVEKLVKYYNRIDNENREKEWELSKLENEKQLKNKIVNNESLYVSELDNRPKLQITDSLNIKNELEEILNSLNKFSLNDRYINYSISFIFEVDTNGNIINLINKETGNKKPIIFKSIRFNEGGVVNNRNQKHNVSFYYPLSIILNSSSSYHKITVTVKSKNNNYIIERIDKSSYALSSAGRDFFEKEKAKSISHFEALKEYILNEHPIRTTKSSFFDGNYRTFDVNENIVRISLDINRDENIFSFKKTFFNIVEKSN